MSGSKLKRKNAIKVSALFKTLPELLLRMVVVHELRYLREKDHNKAFYPLCRHMEPDYHQLELDLRLFLTLYLLEGFYCATLSIRAIKEICACRITATATPMAAVKHYCLRCCLLPALRWWRYSAASWPIRWHCCPMRGTCSPTRFRWLSARFPPSSPPNPPHAVTPLVLSVLKSWARF